MVANRRDQDGDCILIKEFSRLTTTAEKWSFLEAWMKARESSVLVPE